MHEFFWFEKYRLENDNYRILFGFIFSLLSMHICSRAFHVYILIQTQASFLANDSDLSLFPYIFVVCKGKFSRPHPTPRQFRNFELYPWFCELSFFISLKIITIIRFVETSSKHHKRSTQIYFHICNVIKGILLYF